MLLSGVVRKCLPQQFLRETMSRIGVHSQILSSRSALGLELEPMSRYTNDLGRGKEATLS